MNAKFVKTIMLTASFAASALLISCSSTDTDGSHVNLSGATLPEKPNKAQVKAYVDKILTASKGVKTQSPDDPQVKALAKVGAENADVLIDSIANDSNAYYLAFALVKVADASNKALIISKLPHKQVLASVVFAKGWESDAASALLAGLRDSKVGLSYDWLRSAAKVKSPETKGLLKEHFLKHPYGAAYSVMEENKIHFSPNELDQAFAKMHVIDRGVDTKMAKSGSILALAHVVYAWKSSGKDCPSSIIKLTGYKGDAKYFQSWFDENKEKLVFDMEKEQFVLK